VRAQCRERVGAAARAAYYKCTTVPTPAAETSRPSRSLRRAALGLKSPCRRFDSVPGHWVCWGICDIGSSHPFHSSPRLAGASELCLFAHRELAVAGIHQRHPDASDDEIRVRLVVRLYG